jgi:uncharacterized phiE125 gp8 family phage protein
VTTADYELVTSPDAEPVTLEEAKAHARVYTDADDSEITAFISASREMTERNTRRQLITAEYVMTARGFPRARWFELPRPPLQSVESIKYLDVEGQEQTLSASAYTVRTGGQVYGSVHLNQGFDWPTTIEQQDSVSIEFTAGYGDDPGDVPPPLRQAILMRVAHWYANKESTIAATLMQVHDGPMKIDALYRVASSLNYDMGW